MNPEWTRRRLSRVDESTQADSSLSTLQPEDSQVTYPVIELPCKEIQDLVANQAFLQKPVLGCEKLQTVTKHCLHDL
jgi:hypothetical protein